MTSSSFGFTEFRRHCAAGKLANWSYWAGIRIEIINVWMHSTRPVSKYGDMTTQLSQGVMVTLMVLYWLRGSLESSSAFGRIVRLLTRPHPQASSLCLNDES